MFVALTAQPKTTCSLHSRRTLKVLPRFARGAPGRNVRAADEEEGENLNGKVSSNLKQAKQNAMKNSALPAAGESDDDEDLEEEDEDEDEEDDEVVLKQASKVPQQAKPQQ